MSGTKVDVYLSKNSEAAVLRMRSDALKNLPFATSTLRVSTSLGEAVVTVCGPEDAPPLMLWQGAHCPAPILLSSLSELVKAYRVYTADNPTHGGSLSAPFLPDLKHHGLGRWAAEVMDGLAPQLANNPKPLHMGISFGGAILMDLMCVAPEHIQAAALLVPICLHPDFHAPTLAGFRQTLSILLPLLLYRTFPCSLTRWLLLSTLGDPDADPLLMEWTAVVNRHIQLAKEDFAPPRFTADQLAGYKGPVLVITGAYDVFGGGLETAAQARRVFGSRVECEVYPAKHCFGRSSSGAVQQRVMKFLAGAPVPNAAIISSK